MLAVSALSRLFRSNDHSKAIHSLGVTALWSDHCSIRWSDLGSWSDLHSIWWSDLLVWSGETNDRQVVKHALDSYTQQMLLAVAD